MSSPRKLKRRVWIGPVIGLVAVGIWFYWSQRSRPSDLEPTIPPSPFIRLVHSAGPTGDLVLNERAELLDPTPLFFPTERNYGQGPVRLDRARQPGQVFGSYAPKLTVDERELPARPDTTPMPDRLGDILASGNEAPFAGLGQVDQVASTLPLRSGHLVVQNLRGGDIVINQTLNGFVLPRSEAAPVEFIVLVDSTGLVGEPFVARGSEWEEVDAFLQDYLSDVYRLGGKLPPGRYRVTIGS